MSRRIAFIGLGTMGGPMAAHLAQAGFDLRGHDIDPGKGAALAKAGGTSCASIAEACEGADMAITILPRDEHVRDAVLGPGGLLANLVSDCLVL